MIYALFDGEGLPLAFYDMDAADYDLPAGVVRISRAQHASFMNHQGLRRWQDGRVVPYEPPAPAPLPIMIPADLLMSRLTDDEYDDLDESIRNGETARIHRGWTATTIFEEHTPMWNVLVAHLGNTVPAARKDELLARP